MNKFRPSALQLGIISTLFYVFFLVGIAASRWDAFRHLSPNAWGDVLAGVFGPVAIFWLVLSFYVQSKELRNSVDSLNQQTREFENLVRTQAQANAIAAQNMEDQRRKELLRTLPEFEVRFGGTTKNPDGKLANFVLSNKGEKTQNYEISIDENADFSENQEKNDFDPGEWMPFSCKCKSEEKEDDDLKATITVKGVNYAGKARTQVFSLAGGAIVLIDDKF